MDPTEHVLVNKLKKCYVDYSLDFICLSQRHMWLHLVHLLHCVLACCFPPFQAKNFSSDKFISNPCYPLGYDISFKAEDFLLVPCTRGKHAVASYGFEIVVPDWVKPNTTYRFMGVESYKDCADNVKKLFKKGPCPATTCSFNSVYQPPITGSYKVRKMGRQIREERHVQLYMYV